MKEKCEWSISFCNQGRETMTRQEAVDKLKAIYGDVVYIKHDLYATKKDGETVLFKFSSGSLYKRVDDEVYSYRLEPVD